MDSKHNIDKQKEVISLNGNNYDLFKISNPKLKAIIKKRAISEHNKFIFSGLFGGGHKDYTEHTDEGNKGSYHCHYDAKEHTDIRKYNESYYNEETHSESTYDDEYTETHS